MRDEINKKALLFSPNFIKQREYWLNKLGGDLTGIDLRLADTTAASPPLHNRQQKDDLVRLTISPQLSGQLLKLSSQADITIYIILLAGLNALIYRYFNLEDITVVSPVYQANVSAETLNDSLFIRERVTGSMTFKDLLLALRQTVLQAYENQDYPSEKIIDHLFHSSSHPTQQHRFDSNVCCLLENIHHYREVNRKIHFKGKVAFVFRREETRRQVCGELIYDPEFFGADYMERMAGHYTRILEQLTGNVNQSISSVSFLSAQERKQLVRDFNCHHADFSGDKSIHQWVALHAQQTPHRVVLLYNHHSVTVGLLNERAKHLAELLIGCGIQRDQTVGILMERSPLMAESILATWKAEGAYIPLDPRYPPSRVTGILRDAGTPVLLTQSRLVTPHLQETYPGKIIKADQEPAGDSPVRGNSLPSAPQSVRKVTGNREGTSLAYVIYTSGSTGKPKGAMVEHIGMMNHIRAKIHDLELNHRSVIAQNASHTFDISVWQFFTALVTGGKTVIYPDPVILEPRQFITGVIREQITVLEVVPSYLSVLLEVIARDRTAPHPVLPLVYLLVTGEEVKSALVKQWFAHYPGIKMVNAYGPTEASDDITHQVMAEAPAAARIPIGKPLQNLNIYIVDENMNLCPIGIKGEIYVSGVGVGRGYLNEGERTAAAFTRDPFSEKKGVSLYKTGDLGRWLENGTIDFFGRKDSQVKIRGFRIELGEIETQLLHYNGIKEAAVLVREDTGGNKYLCAYLVPGEQCDIPGLRAFLPGVLPYYMVPDYFVELERMPLTANGKINRQALPIPGTGAEDSRYTAPRDEMEAALVGIWSEVLGIPGKSIGIDSNFFEMGGQSLKATVLLTRIHKELNVKLPLTTLFNTPHIRELARHIRQGSQREFAAIAPVEVRDYYELSPAQKRLYILQQIDPAGIGYNIFGALRLEGALDYHRLEWSFHRLIQRHESLRTSFHLLDGTPVQRIGQKKGFGIENYQLHPEATKNDIDHMFKDFIRPFDLAYAPLLRVGLIKTSPDGHILLVDMHHIVSDGVSQDILVNDFMALYREEQLPALRIQYKDYSRWQAVVNKQDKGIFHRREAYWLGQFADEVPVLHLPADYNRPALQDFKGNIVKFKVGKEEAQVLHRLALEEDATLYMVLLSLFTVLLAKLGNQEDIVVGTPVAGRSHADSQQVIGFFVNTLALRNQPSGEKTFREFLREVRHNTLKAFENQDYPFEELVEKVLIKRDASRNPLFDVMFAFQNMEQTTMAIPGLKLAPYEFDSHISKFDITFNGTEGPDQVDFGVEYCVKLFTAETIRRFINYFLHLVGSLAQNPDTRLGNVGIITREEKQRILYDFNRLHSPVDYPRDKTLQQLFEAQAAQTPHQTALAGLQQTQEKDHNLSYKELNKKSHQLAHLLRKKGVKSDTIVAIMMERSLEMIIGILGILKANGAYMPIDPDYPEERQSYMLSDSGVNVLVTTGFLARENEKIKKWGGETILWEPAAPTPTSTLTLASTSQVSPANLAYVIYTSGTTGKPKGSLVEHKNVVRLMFNNQFPFDFNDRDVWTLFHSACFDFSVWEMYGALLYGGKLLIIPQMTARDTVMFRQVLSRELVTVLNQTPSAFYNLIDQELNHPDQRLHLRYVIFGGEALKPLRLTRWAKKYPGTKLINMFGITETTVHVTFKEIRSKDIELNSGSIGTPIPTLIVYVMDRYRHLLPVGVAGELCVGGDGVCRGYLNRPALTAKRFVEFINEGGAYPQRLYRSGDQGRFTGSGELEYLGRIDRQVKIRGYRVETGEIESQLLNHEQVKEAVVVLNDAGNLCAYMVVDSPDRVTGGRLRDYLSARLPGYMVPPHFVRVESIPLTPNGKIDYRALPAPEVGSEACSYTAPEDELETRLVNIWARVLGIEKERIGRDSNFFELGGHSLNATLMLSRIHKELNIKVPLSEIFINPDVRGIARYVRGAVKSQLTVIPAVEKKEWYTLSSAQSRLYALQRVAPDSTGYHVPGVVQLSGILNRERLEAAIKQLIQRHESLRTSFQVIDSQSVQRVGRQVDFKIESPGQGEQSPLNNRTESKVSAPIDIGMIAREFIRPFDLSRPPLLRVGLIKEREDIHILMMDMHHIISDGISMTILLKDFMAIYKGEELPPLRIQYSDYSEWNLLQEAGAAWALQEAYWLKRFQGPLPVLDLPTDYTRPAARSTAGSSIDFQINTQETNALKWLASEEGATLYMVLLALTTILLAKICNQPDIIIGVPVAGRRHPDLELVIGDFINMLPLRNSFVPQQTFRTFLNHLKIDAVEAFENQDYPFDNLVEKIHLKRDMSRNPIFDVVCALGNMETTELEIPGLTLKPYPRKNDSAKYDLLLNAFETGDSLVLTLVYSTRLFHEDTINKYIEYFQRIKGAVLENPDTRLCEISIGADRKKQERQRQFSDDLENE